MVNFHFDSRSNMTFILAAQPELRELLKYAPFAAVRQRIRISYHMPPMSLQETCSYIDHHTARCGRPTLMFADDAKADIHRHAGGLPLMAAGCAAMQRWCEQVGDGYVSVLPRGVVG